MTTTISSTTYKVTRIESYWVVSCTGVMNVQVRVKAESTLKKLMASIAPISEWKAV